MPRKKKQFMVVRAAKNEKGEEAWEPMLRCENSDDGLKRAGSVCAEGDTFFVASCGPKFILGVRRTEKVTLEPVKEDS